MHCGFLKNQAMRRLVAAFLFLVLGVGLGLFLVKSWPLFESIYPPLEEGIVSREELSHKVGVWFVWWDQDNGLNTLKENFSVITSLKPFWYQVEGDGSLKKYSGAEDGEVIAFAREKGFELIAVINNNHDSALLEPILAREKLSQRHIGEIVSLIKDRGYDGVEIDYESLRSSYREEFSAFMELLAEAVHGEGKILSAALHAKTSEPGTWDGPQSQDWEALGAVCDQVKIMTYDYHWSTSKAGAISPLGWVEEVIKFALTKIPREKIYLGVPLYGYDWVGERANSLTWEEAQELVERYRVTPERDPASKELRFSYTKNGKKHEVWFNDAASVGAKLALVKKYQLAGVGIWRVGQEDPGVWAVIRESFSSSD